MKNFTVTEISKKLNITHSSVSQWFSGKTKPTVENAIKMQVFFNIPFTAWQDIKSYIQENDNTIKSNTTRVQREDKNSIKASYE